MDPINIIIGLNLIATFVANASGTKSGFISKLKPPKEKPKTYLQKLPVYLAVFSLLAVIIGIFQIGTFAYGVNNEKFRLIGLVFYLIFSWVQIFALKILGENYSQEIVIFKNHKLITSGPFRFLRHPQYLSQILMDLGGALATMSYIALALSIIEIPFIILRASFEEKLLEKNFKEEFLDYKKKSGFLIPFIG